MISWWAGLSDPALGQGLAAASAAAFAFANNFVSRTTASGGDKGVTFSVLVTMAISAVLWLLLEKGALGEPGIGIDWRAFGLFAVAGILAMVFGRTLVFESIRRLGVSRSTAIKRLNPFFSVILAALLLGEAVTGPDMLGMLAIALAFGVLIHESLLRPRDNAPPKPSPAAYLFGVFGALAYAAAYVARKAGLDLWQAPAFGTFLSAATGFVAFALLTLVSIRHRSNFMGMFRHLDRWIFAAAVMVSFGQILLFAALAYEKVSTVVMIASLEIFLSIFLSVLVFRSERMPGPLVLLAAGLAMVGVALVAME
jgi:drug/metabolite transporter (DMT)-like permease